MKQILLVEDDGAIARYIELELGHEGYSLQIERDGDSGLAAALNNEYDLILLDVMLPKISGLEVLRRLRQAKRTKVILLTAKGEVPDKVAGLDAGADDYITKPFHIEELLARIRANLRDAERSAKLACRGLVLNEDMRQARVDDREVSLTKREFDLLAYLLRNRNLVLSREQIIETVWRYDYYGDTNIVDVYVRNIRQKIEPLMRERILQTVRGVGYVIKD